MNSKLPEYILHLQVRADDSADGDRDGIRRLRGLPCKAIRPPMPDETEGQR